MGSAGVKNPLKTCVGYLVSIPLIYTLLTSITVDASESVIGAQLQQMQKGRWVPLAFFSRKLSPTEQKYSAFDRELLSAYQAVKHFRHFIKAKSFTLYTDRKSLTYVLSSNAERSPRQARHLFFIVEFNLIYNLSRNDKM